MKYVILSLVLQPAVSLRLVYPNDTADSEVAGAGSNWESTFDADTQKTSYVTDLLGAAVGSDIFKHSVDEHFMSRAMNCNQFETELLDDHLRGGGKANHVGQAEWYLNQDHYDAWEPDEWYARNIGPYDSRAFRTLKNKPGFNEAAAIQSLDSHSLQNRTHIPDSLYSKFCSVKEGDGGFGFHRVGPFTSHGGTDWWYQQWGDAGKLSRILETHPNGVTLSQFAFTVKDNEGAIIGFPPIQHHHGYMTSKGAHQGLAEVPLLDQVRPRWFGADNNEKSQCRAELGGEKCTYMPAIQGAGIAINQTLALDFLCNDVRKAGSEPLTWWLEWAYHWVPSKKVKPISQMIITNPGWFALSHQTGVFDYFRLPTDGVHLLWYSGRLPKGGKLLGVHGHSHVLVNELMMFSAHPKDLGLTDKKYYPEIPWRALKLDELGFASIAHMRSWMMGNLKKAGQEHDAQCPNNNCATPRPRMICSCAPNASVIAGVQYHVRMMSRCNEWTFRKYDYFTVVGFYDGYDPNYPINVDRKPPPPEMLQHNLWGVHYYADEPGFNFNYIHFVQNPDAKQEIWDETVASFVSNLVNGGNHPGGVQYSAIIMGYVAIYGFKWASQGPPVWFCMMMLGVAISMVWCIIRKCCQKDVP